MITVITGAAVAFFQSTRIERFVSRNYADLARAQLAAESGHALAASLLRAATANDHFIVVLNPTNRQLFLGNGSNQTALSTFAYLPLFSHATNPTSYTTNSSDLVTASNQPAMSVDGGVTFTNTLPGGLTVTSPAVSWINLTNAEGRTNARFAFWVEDLSGRLDLSVAGSTGTNTARPTGTNPAELALWSLFEPESKLASNNPVVSSLTNVRAALLTPATARLVDSNAVTTNLLADLAAGLIHDTNEPEVIPYGFGYVDAGKFKVDLNSSSAETIAKTISDNLPDFKNRSGGLDATTYINQIAVNIVDYRDTDSSPTRLGNALGIDSYPYVTELTVLYRLVRTDGSDIFLSREPFMELWNFTDQPFDGELEISLTCSDNLVNSLGQPAPFNSTAILNTNYNIPAGAYRALALPTNEVKVSFGAPPSPPNNRRISWAETNQGGSFELKVGKKGAEKFLVQTQLGGLQRRANTTYGISGDALPINDPDHWIYRGQTNMPAAGNVQLLGDMRSHMLRSGFRATDLTTVMAWPTYSSGNHYGNQSSFGGRNPGTSWTNLMEKARDTPRGSSPGNSVAGLKTRPTEVSPQANDTNKVLQKIRNANIVSAVELGRIYDPCLWNWTAPSTDIPSGATSHPNRGGGNTLRIGRKEHPKFSTNGQNAHQLLDLFAGTTNTAGPGGSVIMKIPGKINLNTASSNTLRALVAGVVHSNDPDQRPSGDDNLVVSGSAVTMFLDAATSARAIKPFFSPSELSNLTNPAGEAVFGNSNSLGVTDWNDVAAEEWFSKIHNLAAVRSRNFLIHVVGQAMRTNQSGGPIASSRMVVQVFASPQRSAAGLTTNVILLNHNKWSF